MNRMRRIVYISALASLFLFGIESGAKTNLRILTENWPPVSYEENGTAKGMAVELVQRIQRDLGDNTKIEVIPWARGYRMLLDKPNTVLFTVVRNPERERLFTMLGPLAHGNTSLFALNTKATAKPRSLHEIREKAVIAATRGTAFEAVLHQQKIKNIVDVGDTETGVKLLLAGRVDYLCDDSLVITDIQRKLSVPANRMKSMAILDQYDLYLGFSPGTDPVVLQSWRQSLERLKKSGAYGQIHRKWFGEQKTSKTVELIGLVPPALKVKAPEKPERKRLWAERQKQQVHDL